MSDSSRAIFTTVRSTLVISLITLIIWLLAESESLRTEKLRIEVTFRGDPDVRLVKLSPTQDFNGNITLKLEGSNARVDALAAALRKGVQLKPGDDGVTIQAGEQSINLESAIRSLPVVRNSGVSVTEVEPSTAIIIVDNMNSQMIPVRVIIPEGRLIEGGAEVSPSTVQFTYPVSMAKDFPIDLAALARLEPAALASLPEGRQGTIHNITLELPAEVWPLDAIKLSPSQVSVSVQLRSRVDVYSIASVPVQLRLPVDATGKYDLDTDISELKDVSVVGPIDLIEQIKAGKLNPIATISLTTQELERATITGQVLAKEPLFSDIPTPLPFDAKQKVIRVLVRKRDTAPPK